MKILMCAQEYPPRGSGIGNVVYYLKEELNKNEIRCDICSPVGPEIKLGSEKLCLECGVFGLLHFWCKVAKFIKKNEANYDLIVVHNPLFLNEIKSKKIVSIVHTTYRKYFRLYKNNANISYFNKFYYFLMSFIESYCYKINIFRTSCVSEEVCDEVTELGLKKSEVKYISNGVDIYKFCPEEKAKIILGKPIKLLSVGRLNDQKRPLELISLFYQLSKLNKNLSLTIVGDGELRIKCKRLINKLQLKNVHLIGWLKHDLLGDVYRKSDFYIMASCYEGQPLTVFEAMSSGLPCILSNISNLSFFVKDSGAGILFNLDNKNTPEIIVNYIKYVPFKKEKKLSREFITDNYSWKKVLEIYLQFWKND